MAGFDAQMEGKAVRLLWETAFEESSAGFGVQRKAARAAEGG